MRLNMFKNMKIRNKITLLAVFIVVIILSTVGFIIERNMVNRFEDQLSSYAMGIAHSVAEIPNVKLNVGKPGGELIIQPIVEKIRKNTDAEFIVVIDMQRVRYSHPVPERIGKKFVGGDEGPVLQGKEYTSRAVGTLGPSLRALVPIFKEGEQVGAVAVGIMLDDVNTLIGNIRSSILVTIFLGLLIGTIGANFLALNIKESMFGLEPQQIASLLKEREALLESVREGIIAVDKYGKITFLNSEARRILRITEDIQGRDVRECVPNTRLPEVIKNGEVEFDMEQNILNTRLLTNRVPIKVNEEIVGAIASFRDMTEIQAMAEELTGVRKYVESLRVQNHEFSNKLHTISGLIQLGENEKAVEYISLVSDFHQYTVSFITERIKDPAVGGLLLGKKGRCAELGIEFQLDKDSYLGPLKNIDYNVLVVIIGNLIENSMEAVAQSEVKKISVAIFDESNKIFISVRDTGVGISEEVTEEIFKKDFTTKGDKRGYGLFLIKSMVESCQGEIYFESKVGQGTEFTVIIPNGVA